MPRRSPACLRPILLPVLFAACGEGAPVQRFGGDTMGSTYAVQFVADVPLATVRAAVERELAAIDLAFSQWRDDSEISRCNAHASTEPFPVSAPFAAALQLALRVAALTDGAFDPTVKPLSDAYRAGKRDPNHHLDPAVLAMARQRVGYRLVEVRDGAVHKLRPDVQIDLDGLVAGVAADALAERLHALGVPSFFLEITGEVLAHGEKAPGVPWVAGVVDPRSDAAGGGEALCAVPLRDRSLCTSGVYRNGYSADGRFVHHVFDARTGTNAAHPVVSASVIARRAAVADALGTAFLVLGDAGTEPCLPGLRDLEPDLGVLLLVGDAEGGLRRVEFGWPR